MANITIKILKDGTIVSETHGIKGDGCKEYSTLLENLTESKTVKTTTTLDYVKKPTKKEEKQKEMLEQS